MKLILKSVIALLFIPTLIVISDDITYRFDFFNDSKLVDNKAPVHFYVINLDRSIERFNLFQKQAARFGISVERFPAIDGYQMVFVDQDTHEVMTGMEIKNKTKEIVMHHKYDTYCTKESYDNKDAPEFVYHAGENTGRTLAPGQIGLNCSARLLWKKIAAKKDKEISVIFEDDAILLDNFNQNFEHFISALPPKWDIAYLDANYFRPYDKKKITSWRWKLKIPSAVVNKYLVKIHPQSYVSGAYAYVINDASATKLLESSSRDTSRALDGLFGYAIRDKTIVAYIAKDKIVSFHNDFGSDIDNMMP